MPSRWLTDSFQPGRFPQRAAEFAEKKNRIVAETSFPCGSRKKELLPQSPTLSQERDAREQELQHKIKPGFGTRQSGFPSISCRSFRIPIRIGSRQVLRSARSELPERLQGRHHKSRIVRHHEFRRELAIVKRFAGAIFSEGWRRFFKRRQVAEMGEENRVQSRNRSRACGTHGACRIGGRE